MFKPGNQVCLGPIVSNQLNLSLHRSSLLYIIISEASADYII